jgi:hypothetical protein
MLSGFVLVFVGSVLLFGFLPATGLAATSIGSFGDMGRGMGMGGFGSGMGDLMQGGAGGYAIAGALGTGVLWALALTLVFQVSLLGANLAYLRVGEGIDASAAERAVQERLEQAKRKAAEVGQQAKEATERARAQAERVRAQAAAAAEERRTAADASVPDVQTAAPLAVNNRCPQCNANINARDLFCGECGHKLTTR